jgi:hypothetical protein
MRPDPDAHARTVLGASALDDRQVLDRLASKS